MFASIAAFVIYLVTINVFIPNLNDIIRGLVGKLLAMNQLHLYVVIGSAVLAMYVLSWLLSVRIYRKKVF